MENLARALSLLGGEYLYLLLIPSLLWFAPWSTAVPAARAMVFADLVGEWIKWTLEWPRPPATVALALETSPGFVSTHASISMAVATVVGAHHPRLRPWLGLWVVGVGWSRLFLGVHFPIDVLGGWALGIAIAALILAFGDDRRLASHVSLAVGLLIAALWPVTGGAESLQRDLGMLFGLEGALLLRFAGANAKPAPAPLSPSRGVLRLLALIALYAGLKALALPRILRYLMLALVAAGRSRE